jgi:hypothetical protein
MTHPPRPNTALAIAEEAAEAGVISPELIALYREKDRAFEETCARYTDEMQRYTQMRAGAAIDDVDRQFSSEGLAHILKAMRELHLVKCAVNAVLQVAYQASLQDDAIARVLSPEVEK